jgi:hypothetical protein
MQVYISLYSSDIPDFVIPTFSITVHTTWHVLLFVSMHSSLSARARVRSSSSSSFLCGLSSSSLWLGSQLVKSVSVPSRSVTKCRLTQSSVRPLQFLSHSSVWIFHLLCTRTYLSPSAYFRSSFCLSHTSLHISMAYLIYKNIEITW